MKKILALGIFCFVTLFAVACSKPDEKGKNPKFDLENTVIKNFSNYSYIGAGYIDNSSSNAGGPSVKLSFLSDTGNDEEYNMKLVGKNKDGDFEEVKYENDKGEEIEQTWRLKDMTSIGRFTFVTYTNLDMFTFNQWADYTVGSGAFYLHWGGANGDSDKTYVIDSLRGKVYPITEEFSNTVHSLEMNPVYGQLQYTENEIYVLKSGTYGGIYKIYIEEDKLALKKIIGYEHTNIRDRNMMVDRYGNVFLQSADNDNSFIGENAKSYEYVIKNNLTLGILDDETHLAKSVNGVVYSMKDVLGETKIDNKINEFGEFVDIEEGEGFVYSHYNLVNVNGNDKYYVYEDKLLKTTWTNSDFVISEEIELTRNYNEYAYISNRIYFLHESSIYYYDLENNNYYDVTSDYLFDSISVGYDNDILFTGIDFSLNEINGIIKSDGSLEIETNKREWEIMYIEPLN